MAAMSEIPLKIAFWVVWMQRKSCKLLNIAIENKYKMATMSEMRLGVCQQTQFSRWFGC